MSDNNTVMDSSEVYKNMKLEDIMLELDNVLNKLEDGNIPLEDAFDLYHQGMIMMKECNEKIDTVEKKMIILQNESEEE